MGGGLSGSYRKASQLPDKPEGALWNTDEAAAYLCVSPETVRRLVRAKVLAHVSVTPSEYRFTLEDLREYIAAKRHQRLSGV
jgi:excisionase family DNA binding protein